MLFKNEGKDVESIMKLEPQSKAPLRSATGVYRDTQDSMEARRSDLIQQRREEISRLPEKFFVAYCRRAVLTTAGLLSLLGVVLALIGLLEGVSLRPELGIVWFGVVLLSWRLAPVILRSRLKFLL